MFAENLEPTSVRRFLLEFPCFHEALALRGEREVNLRHDMPAAASLLIYEGEQRRLAFMTVAAACMVGGPKTTYDTPGIYLVASALAQAYESFKNFDSSFEKTKKWRCGL